ncbi:MAG TPA: hypothetical protein VIK27_04715 [Candidatus Aquilonibacter sp.]
MLAAVLTAMMTATPWPSPAAAVPLETIGHASASPLCTTIRSTVLHAIEGLRANDRVVESSKSVLLQMGSDFIPQIPDAAQFDKQQARWGTVPGGVHDTNPALVFDDEQLRDRAEKILHNLGIIDALLNDPARFTVEKKTEVGAKAQLLKRRLQAVADEQHTNLNILFGIADTTSLQDLIAKGDGTQGAINAAGPGHQVSHNDQDLSFQDATSGPERGRLGHAVDPTLDQDPAISQPPTDLANNSMARFYLTVLEHQRSTARAENALDQTVVSTAADCRAQ